MYLCVVVHFYVYVCDVIKIGGVQESGCLDCLYNFDIGWNGLAEWTAWISDAIMQFL